MLLEAYRGIEMGCPEWFWESHRIPRNLEIIESGHTGFRAYCVAYFIGWAIYQIPNFWDLIRYCEVLYDKE